MDKNKIKELVEKKCRSTVLKRKPFILAINWKMNKTSFEIEQYLQELQSYSFSEKNMVIIFPPSAYLYLFLQNTNHYIKYGPQNLYFKNEGAFTGEISPMMANDFGCGYSILGHSERRDIFHESNEIIERKVSASIAAGIKPVLCIGEHLEERQSDNYKDALYNQLEKGLAGVNSSTAHSILIAYEPVWAIGTGESATSEQIEKTHGVIREKLISMFGFGIGSQIPILYGGSVNPENISFIALCKNVAGFLIGGAALDVKKFIKMMDLVNEKVT